MSDPFPPAEMSQGRTAAGGAGLVTPAPRLPAKMAAYLNVHLVSD